MAEGEIIFQVLDRSSLPLAYPVGVKIILQGKGHRGDLDNSCGAILDALVGAGILVDDRLSCVSRLVAEHHPKGSIGCWVEIAPMG